MKKILLTALIAGIPAAPAFAATYISGSIGSGLAGNTSFTQAGGAVAEDVMKWKSGTPFVGAIGIRHDRFRAEIALGYQSHELDKLKDSDGNYVSPTGPVSSVSAFTFMLNGYYDINFKLVSPYVMTGIGNAALHPSDPAFTAKGVFTWQLGTGVGIRAAKDLTVDLGVRYLKPGSFEDSSNSLKASVSYTNILAGLRYDF